MSCSHLIKREEKLSRDNFLREFYFSRQNGERERAREMGGDMSLKQLTNTKAEELLMRMT